MIGETIAAISTPRGKGGVAMLRVSGPDALTVCARVFRPMKGASLADQPARRAIYGEILAPVGAEGAWQSVDDGIATVYRAPASFTGEDTVEICCHGGMLLTETVLSALLSAGAAPAAAGEFTKRAFLNGKLGLSAAEALGNILEAQTREQLVLAHGGLRGRVEDRCAEIYGALRRILAAIYVRIDYPDEDLADMTREEIEAALQACEGMIDALLQSYRTGHAVAEGIPTVICGKPNVGKSSLYNRILGRDAAIVTSLEGTTRDVLTETASLGRVTLRLSDTAGLRETDNPVEQIGIARADAALEEAELILAVFDGSRAPDEEERQLARRLSAGTATVIAVINKADLEGGFADAYGALGLSRTVAVSAEDGRGMDTLRATVEELFVNGALDVRRDAILTNARQYAAAYRAAEAVRRAIAALGAGMEIDLCCIDVEDAMSALAELDGREISEDIVGEIFSRFCVGK